MTSVSPLPLDLWQRTPPEVQQALLVVFANYEAQIQQLKDKVAQLEQRLGLNSTNSSKPPSSDGPHVKRSPPKAKGARRPGGQPGHPRHVRPLLPADCTTTCKPGSCRRCGKPLEGDDPDPLRHQVLELPQVKPIVHEYQLHRLLCPCCGVTTCASLPEGVPQGGQGPRLQAAVALLTGAYQLSKEQAADLLGVLCGVPLSPGCVCRTEAEVAAAVQPAVDEALEEGRSQPVNMDETTFKQGRQRGWFWVAVTTYLTVYHWSASRSADVARGMLGEGYDQPLTTDRLSSYTALGLSKRQLCWAHLRRDFQAMIDRGDEGSEVGRELLECSDWLFRLWHEFKAGLSSREELIWAVGATVRPWVKAELERGSRCGSKKAAGTCAAILEKEEWLWTFVTEEGVEPTNNAAERALRRVVVLRKKSGGAPAGAGGPGGGGGPRGGGGWRAPGR